MGVGKQKRRDKEPGCWRRGSVTAQDNCQEQKEKHLGLWGGGRELGGKEGPVVPS